MDKLCTHCGRQYEFGGPIWAEPIHSTEFVTKLMSELTDYSDETRFATYKRLYGMLNVINEELLDVPLYYCLHRLCRVVQCPMPTMKVFRSALLNGGFRVSYSHANKNSLKTDAPNGFLWDILREWRKRETCKNELTEEKPGFAIINKETNRVVSFDIHEQAEPPSKERQLLRYQVNPEAYWGPMPKPRSNYEDKRARNQNKRKRINAQENCINSQTKKVQYDEEEKETS